MAGGDPSALDLFLTGGLSNPSNRILYLNAIASSVATTTNAPPTVTIDSASPSGDEGAAIGLDATAADDGPVTTSWSYTAGAGVDPGATCAFADPSAVDTTITCTDDGTFTVTLTADDGTNAPVSAGADVSVANVAPSVEGLVVNGGSGEACSGANTVSASFAASDPGANDTLSGDIDWGDGSPTEPSFSASHTYAAGSYTLIAAASDDDGGRDAASTSVTTLSYETSGILPPINADGSSNFKLGRVIPVEIRITDCDGLPVTTLAPRVSLRKVGSGSGEVNEVVSASAADDGNTMRASADSRYTFNLSTKLSQFNARQDLSVGRYELKITDATIAAVIVEFDLRP